MNLLPVVAGSPATPVGTPADFPLVLTTVRCVEHFQGGPITRNNWFNVELEPEPWIELNSADARANGIKDGDYVKIVTARTEALVNNEMPSTTATDSAPESASDSRRARRSVSASWRFHGTGVRRVCRPAPVPTTCVSTLVTRTRPFLSPRPVSAASRRCREV